MQPIYSLETPITNHLAVHGLAIARLALKLLNMIHSNIKSDYYGSSKDCSIYFNDYHLKYFQLKFIIIYETILNSILLIGLLYIYFITQIYYYISSTHLADKIYD